MDSYARALIAGACCLFACGASAGVVSTGDVTAPFLQLFPPPDEVEYPPLVQASLRIAAPINFATQGQNGSLTVSDGAILRSAQPQSTDARVGLSIGSTGVLGIESGGTVEFDTESNVLALGQFGGIGNMMVTGGGSRFVAQAACSDNCGTNETVFDPDSNSNVGIARGQSLMVVGSLGGTGTLAISEGGQFTLDAGDGGASIGSIARANIGATLDDFIFTLLGLPSLVGAQSSGLLRVEGTGSRMDIRADVAELTVAELLPALRGLPPEAQDENILGTVEVLGGGQIVLTSPTGHARTVVSNTARALATLTVAGSDSMLDSGQRFVAGYANAPVDGTVPSGLGGAAVITLDDGGRLRADQVFLGERVEVVGNGGTIEGNVTNAGLLSPGQSPGVLDIMGDLTLLPTSRLRFEIGGTAAGTEYDVLRVSGQLMLGGMLEVVYLGDFLPDDDDMFRLFDVAATSGRFSSIVLPRGEVRRFDLVDGRFFVSDAMHGVPTPATFWMVLAVALATAALRSRRETQRLRAC